MDDDDDDDNDKCGAVSGMIAEINRNTQNTPAPIRNVHYKSHML
jgi:hypothetical protein